jgi:hypothetical protein
MKLYRTKIPVIAKETIENLCELGDIEVEASNREEAEQDLVAIMEEFMRQDYAFRNKIKDHMASRGMPYDKYGEARKVMSETMSHPLGDDIERFLARQFVENLMISRFIEEVYEEDSALYKKVLLILKTHHVDEREIRDEALAKIKNIKEGTVDFEIALNNAVRDVKRRKGLLT